MHVLNPDPSAAEVKAHERKVAAHAKKRMLELLNAWLFSRRLPCLPISLMASLSKAVDNHRKRRSARVLAGDGFQVLQWSFRCGM